MKNENIRLEVLVIEDNLVHQNAARELLKDYDLTIISTFDEAADVICGDSKKEYDVVLTDMFFTQGRGEMMGGDAKKLAKVELPFGYAVALMVCNEGVPNVAIVSDANHHDHPIAYTMDFLSESNCGSRDFKIFQVGNSKLAVIQSPYLKPVYYLKKDGSITQQKPYDLADGSTEKSQFVQEGRYGFQTVKNWKAALDYIKNGKIDEPTMQQKNMLIRDPLGGIRL